MTISCTFCTAEYNDYQKGQHSECRLYRVMNHNSVKYYYCSPLCYLDECLSSKNEYLRLPAWEEVWELFYDKNRDIYNDAQLRIHRTEYNKLIDKLIQEPDIEEDTLEEIQY